MKTKLKSLIIVLLVAMICFFFINQLFLKQKQPSFGGRSMEEWFEVYCRSDDSDLSDATNAFAHFGTNGILFLKKIAFSKATDSSAKKGWMVAHRMLPDLLRGPPPIEAEMKINGSTDLLLTLKPRADLLLPYLAAGTKSRDIMHRRQSIFILGCLGDGAEKAVLYLIRALNDPDPWAQGMAAQSLGFLGPKAYEAVDPLIRSLANSNRLYQSTLALGKIGPSAAPAIPILKDLFQREIEIKKRLAIAGAICRIDPSQSEAMAFITDSIRKQENHEIRQHAIYQLGDLGVHGQTAIPLLMELMNHPNDWISALDALMKLKVDKLILERHLLKKMEEMGSTNKTMFLNAASHLLHLNPNHRRTFQQLAQLVTNTFEARNDRLFAIIILTGQRTTGTNCLPVLKAALKDPDKDIRKTAGEALKKIERWID